jgi:exopolysaccharide production protein ExoZ
MNSLVVRLSEPLQRIYEIPGRDGGLAPMEGLRAYAALLVFAVHYLDPYIRAVYDVDPNTLRLSTIEQPGLMAAYYLFASHYGVDIFFVLSGYLIFRLVSRSGFRYVPFVRRRLTRIYPAALLALVVWAFLRVEVQGWYPWDLGQVFGNLLFLNAVPQFGVTPFNTVTWSLFFELLFYITFPLILLMAREPTRIPPLTVLLFGLAMSAAAWNIGGSFVRFPMFFAGALLASIDPGYLRRMAGRIPGWFILAAFLGSTVLFAETLDYTVFTPVFVITASMFVLHVVFGDGCLSRLFAAAPLRWLGNISYSFYLVHGLGIEIVMYRFHDVFLGLPSWLHLTTTLGASLLLSILFATALFLLAERPYFSRKLGRPAPAVGVPQRAIG